MKLTMAIALTLGISLFGAASVVSQPIITVTPDSLSEHLMVGDSITRVITITNSGSEDLLYNISFEIRDLTQTVFEVSRLWDKMPTATPVSVDYSRAYDLYRNSPKRVDPHIAEGELDDTPANTLDAKSPDSFVVFSDNVEHGVNGWTHSALLPSGGDHWGRSGLRHNSGSRSWYVTPHDSAADDALQSPPIDLSNLTAASMTFYHWYEFDDCSDPNDEPDGGLVEVSMDNGTSWTQVNPFGGYPYVLDNTCRNPLGNRPAYAHSGHAGNIFHPAAFDLSPFVGHVINIRFRAGWDCGHCAFHEGWFVDDITVYSIPYVGWLAVHPDTGSIAPGSSADIRLTFNASTVYGGLYRADMAISSNDPVTPKWILPTEMSVTGIPHLAVNPTSVNFGGRYIGLTVPESLTVSNSGTDVLHISGISSNSSEFVSDSTEMTIPAASSRKLIVRFTPTSLGLRTASLSLVSDDPLNPLFTVLLEGQAIIAPNVVVSPDSLDSHLFTGDQEIKTLTIQNTGGADLNWTMAVQSSNIAGSLEFVLPVLPPNPHFMGYVDRRQPSQVTGFVSPRTSDLRAQLMDLNGANILFDQYHGINSGNWSTLIGNLMSRGANVTTSTSPFTSTGLASFDIVWLVDFYTNPLDVSEISVLRDWVLAGGALLIEGDESIESFNAVLSSVGAGITYDRTGAYAGETTNIFPHPTTSGVSALYLDNPLAILSPVQSPAGVIVQDLINYNNVAYSQAGKGRIIAMANENFANYSIAMDNNQLFGNQVFDWLFGSARFITLDADSGLIPAGGSSDLHVLFDAIGLRGGDYLAQLVLKSNDPYQPKVTVPAHLQVTGTAVLSTSTDSLDFGTRYTGSPFLDTLVISNTGNADLTVTSITSDNPDFVPFNMSFTLIPHGTIAVPITFNPSIAADRAGHLTIVSNDRSHPTISIALHGLGIDPPDIAITPDSLHSELFTGANEIQSLTVSNLGGSDLNWRLNVSKAAGVVMSQYTLPVGDGAITADPFGRSEPANPGIRRTAPLTMSALDLTGVKILFDSYHGNSYSLWTNLGANLRSRGATVTENTARLTAESLQGVDVFWLTDHLGTSISMSTPEVIVLRDWILMGGALLIEGDQSSSSFNAILNAVGSGITYLPYYSNGGTTSQIYPHPTTVGVHTLSLPGPDAILSSVVSPAGVIVKDPSGYNDVAYSTVGDGRIVAMADQLFFNGYLGLSDNQLFANQVFDWLAMAAPYLTVDSDSGRVAAGANATISARFDAKSLDGGTYAADLVFTSNDPDESSLHIPATLHVTGAPNIVTSTDSIDFGTKFVGFPYTDTVIIKNTGNDLLIVSGITSTNPDFVAGTTSFSLAPNALINVAVVFTPSSAVVKAGSLTIASNDPDSPSKTLQLKGVGLIPPDITVSPDSLHSSLFTGARENQFLTLRNVGGSDLNWNMQIIRTNPSSSVLYTLPVSVPRATTDPIDRSGSPSSPISVEQRTSPLQGEFVDLTGVHVLFDQYHGNNYIADWSGMTNNLTSRGATVTMSTAPITSAILANFDIFWLVDFYGSSFSSSEISALRDWLLNGGALLIEGDESNADYNAILSSVGAGITFVSNGAYSGTTTNILPHEMTTDVHSLVISGPLSVLSPVVAPAGVLVKDLGGANAVAYSEIGSGRIVVMANEDLNDYYLSAADNQLFGNQVFDWLSGASAFLTSNLAGGTVAAGGSTDLTMTFNALGLYGGNYWANIRFSSNDPDESIYHVPADLHVTGAADITLSSDSIDYGQRFVNNAYGDSVLVTNKGTDSLKVSAVTSDNSDFVPGLTEMVLLPRQKIIMPVIFTPSSATIRTGNLTILCNDPDSPTITIKLRGQGLIPPVISVSPDSLDVHLLTNQTSVKQLTVTNSGGSDLTLTTSLQFISTTSAGVNPDDQRPLQERLIANHAGQTEPAVVGVRQTDDRAPETGAHSVMAGLYSGDYLQFGLSDYGEIMPFQFPVGNEHLQSGTYVSGYTIAYRVAGVDRIAIAAFDVRSGIAPVSYTERVNTPEFVLIEVVTRTSDNLLTLTQFFTFSRHDKFVHIQSIITNQSASPVTDIVFKSYADWDNDRNYNDNWNYDFARNMVYSSYTNYTAISGGRIPEAMDIDGWSDYGQRATSVNFPTGPVTGYDGLGILDFAMGSLVGGASTQIGTTFGAGSSLAELQAVIDRGSIYGSWLSVNPESAIIPAGTSKIFDIKFDATGLYGGDYFGSILLANNDPATPMARVAAHLNVTGAPTISARPDSLIFGSYFIGSSHRDSIEVRNSGTDQLTVTGISSGNSHFSLSATSFGLGPNTGKYIVVTFVPQTEGDLSTSLTITSNDPVHPVLLLPLHGRGLVPPEIHVTPTAISEEIILSVSPTKTDTITIRNSGRSDLVWNADLRFVALRDSGAYHLAVPSYPPPTGTVDHNPNAQNYAGEFLRTSALDVTLLNLTGVTIAFDQYHGSGSSSNWSYLITDLQNRGATIVSISAPFTASSLKDVDIIWMIDFYGPSLTATELTVFHDWLNAGHGLLIESDESPTQFNAILSTVGAGITYSYPSGAPGISTSISPHETTVGVTSLYLDNPISSLSPVTAPAAVLVRDPGGNINVAYSTSGRGRIIAMANENLSNNSLGYVDNERFGNQVFDWLASPALWLSLSASSGTVTPNLNGTLALSIDATSLASGDYSAILAITSNDPINPTVNVPVVAHVKDYLCGDVNADGSVNTADLNYLIGAYFFYGQSPKPWKSGDVNCDGYVDLPDIAMLAKYLNGVGALQCCPTK